MLRSWLGICLLAALASCGGSPPPGELLIAAAANLEPVLPRLAEEFERETGVRTILSFGSTGSLAQQVEHGAPFDLFLAADVEHVSELVNKGRIAANTQRVYTLGRLALWLPKADGVSSLDDLRREEIRAIAVANPGFAPYGRAAVEALRNAGLFSALEAKIVYAQNVRMAQQYAAGGNADAALTALSVVPSGTGTRIEIEEELYAPIKQAGGVLSDAQRPEAARAFLDFLGSEQAGPVWAQSGYRRARR